MKNPGVSDTEKQNRTVMKPTGVRVTDVWGGPEILDDPGQWR